MRRTDAHYRSVVKAITWRFLATTTTMLIVYLFTGKLVLTLSVGAVEVVLKLLIYYIHERVWQYVPLGRWSRLKVK